MAAHIWTVADAAPVLLRLAGPDGACTWVSSAWRRFRGRDASAELGRGWTEGIHPDDLQDLLAAYRAAVARREGYEVEYRLRRADGRWRWVLERGRPADGADGEPSLVSAALDVTERHRAHEELLRSREELRLALEAGSMGTWVWDRRTGEVSRDTHLHALYGLGPDRSVGSFEEFMSLVHPDDRALVQAEVERAMAEGGTYELEHRIVRPDGVVRWVERRGEAFFDESGAVAGTRGLVVDVTARKEAEAERNRLLAAERQARHAAELAARRVAHLQAVTAGLADARSVADVAEVIVSQGATGLDAGSAALCLANEDGDQLEIIREVGYPPDLVQRFRSFPVDAPLPASECLRSGEMVLLRSLAERDARFPGLADTPARNQSHAAVPLFVHGRASGAIALGWAEPRDFDDGDRAFLLALAQHAGQAVDRARFYESERWRAERQAFLAEASRLLGSSLDYERTLEQVARLAVPPTADACSIHLRDDGGFRLLAAVHRDPAKEDLMRRLGGAWCLSDDQLARVAADGPLLLPRVDDDHRGQAGGDAAHLAALHELATTSAVAVAVGSPNEVFGVLVLGMDGDRRYRPGDLAFVEDVAARAAAAISNGRAHRARTEIARALQHSLLPPEVPVIPGVEVAARYHPLGDEIEVGGDFYDLFRADGARWGLVIGDASGKGVLAASLTALARYTVRTAARREPTASAVLELLNQSILDQGVGERFCTIALALLSMDRGGVRFDVACGGHPLPLLVGPTGEVRPVGRPGTAMGLVESPSLEDESHHLEPGEALVLFTDGMIEARSPDGTFAEGLLEATLAGCGGLSADAIADAVDEALIEFVGGRPRDDTALLVVRRPVEVFDLEILPEARAVSVSRHLLQEWLDRQLAATPAVADDLGLVATELVTNAARAARTGVQLHAAADALAVTLDVSDDGPGFGGRVPVVTSTGATDAIVGTGLRIVGSLVDECVVQSGSSGTVVRCVKRRGR